MTKFVEPRSKPLLVTDRESSKLPTDFKSIKAINWATSLSHVVNKQKTEPLLLIDRKLFLY